MGSRTSSRSRSRVEPVRTRSAMASKGSPRVEDAVPRGSREWMRALAQQALHVYRDDPVRFAQDFFGHVDRHGVYHPARVWERQAEIMMAVAACAALNEGRAAPPGAPDVGRKRRVAVRSGHKVGKSRTAAYLALWWYCTRPDGRVVMTSSSNHQIKNILWRELAKLFKNARYKMGGQLARDPGTGLQAEDGREVLGLSTNEPERMAGISSPALLYILDEASGIPDVILEAILGNSAGGGVIVGFSNPTRTSGFFFDAWHSRAEQWHGIRVSSEEAAAVTPPIPGLARREWIEDMAQESGRDSPFFQVRVLGEFPTQAENAVIPLHLVEAGVRRWRELVDSGKHQELRERLHIGGDVARFGDDETAIVWRRGPFASLPSTFSGLDERGVAQKILTVARGERVQGEIPVANVDVVGLGAAVVALLDAASDLEVVPIHAQDKPDAEGFVRMRDQLWWGCREWLKGGGAIPDDPKLRTELVAPTYSFDAQGRVKVESKDEMKKKIGRSPDRADALCLAVYQGGEGNAEVVVTDQTRMPRARFSDQPDDRVSWGANRHERRDWSDGEDEGDEDD